eukprot:8115662-Ditylum_brightwellii.AAC.1
MDVKGEEKDGTENDASNDDDGILEFTCERDEQDQEDDAKSEEEEADEEEADEEDCCVQAPLPSPHL